MISHIVLFRPRASLAPAERQSFLDAFTTATRDIPSIRRARVGTRVLHGRQYEQLMRDDYSHAAVIEFDDVAGLRAYLEHPSHERLGSQLFEYAEAMLIYDYETTDSSSLADASRFTPDTEARR